MSRSIRDNKNCTGCGICRVVCPKNAIILSKDRKGFNRPEVNENCIDCGLCFSKCHEHKSYQGQKVQKAFTAYSNNTSIRNESSSGGLFSEIAISVINQGGFVCAAGFDQDYVLRHKIVYSVEGLEGLRKSKYLESDVAPVWEELKILVVEKQMRGLFVGTPCQCAALRSYFGKDAKCLLVCDFICHGVASPILFDKFKSHLNILYGRPKKIEFRHKINGNGSYFYYQGESGEYLIPNYTKSYPYAYASGMIIADDCTYCDYSRLERYSDITLGDYVSGPTDYSKSTIFVNTSKGMEFLHTLVDETVIQEENLQEVISKSWHLTKPNNPNSMREKLFSNIDKPWDYLERKYFHMPSNIELIMQKIVNKVRKHIQI